MRRKLWLASVAALLALGTSVLAILGWPVLQRWQPPPVARLPEDSEIASMRATLYRSQVGFDPIPEFAVPPAHIPGILRWFRPPKYVRHPPIFPEDLLGELSVTTKQGDTIGMKFYWTGVNPPAFTENGVDFFWGDPTYDKELDHGIDGGVMAGRAIVEAYADSVKEAGKPPGQPDPAPNR